MRKKNTAQAVFKIIPVGVYLILFMMIDPVISGEIELSSIQSYRFDLEDTELIVVNFIPFDLNCADGIVTSSTIDQKLAVLNIASTGNSYFTVKLLNMLAEGYAESMFGSYDGDNVRLRILIRSLVVLVDRNGTVVIISQSGQSRNMGRISEVKLAELQHHFERYRGFADLKLLQARRPWADPSPPTAPSLPSALTPVLVPTPRPTFHAPRK